MKIIHEGSVYGTSLPGTPVKQVIQSVYHNIEETAFYYLLSEDNIDKIFTGVDHIVAVWKVKMKEVKYESI